MTVFNMFTNHIDRAINKINAEGEAIDLDIEFNQDLKIITMRPNQKYVYETYPNEQYFNMIEPMGAGKSMTLKYLCTKLLEDNKDLKVIIIVPRTLIANTFKKETLEYPDGTIRKWDIGKNLCDDHQDKIDTLISFLKRTKFPKGIRNRVCVTTHIAFSMLQDKVRDIDNLFDNTLVIIDEAHHVLSPDYDAVETSNKIGGVVGKILKRNHKSTSLWLVSATLFRGDRGNIIPPHMIDMFTEHFLPFDQHWKENIKYIETFEYNFVIYDDVFKDIQAIIKKNKKKTIIFCPYNGHLLKGSDKFQFRDKLHHKIEEVWPGYRSLDLIDPNGRKERKKELDTYKDAEQIDIIYSLKLFDEGTDWKYASQAIDAAPRDSLGLQIQKLGRILRDLKGKKHVAYNILFPQQSVFETETDRVDHLKKMFAVLAGALILREAIQPLPYPQLPEPRKVSPFEEAIPNPTIRKEIIQKISEELTCYASINKNPTPTETREKIKEILKDEFDIEDGEDYSVTTHIGLMLKRMEQTASPIINKPQPNWEPSIDLTGMVKAGFDKIFEKSIYNTLLTFGTAAAGVETFDEFRKIYELKNKTPTKWRRIAQSVVNSDGIIPTQNALLKINSGLRKRIIRHPEDFIGMKQFTGRGKRIRIIGDNTKPSVRERAIQMAKNNNGILPSQDQLERSKEYEIPATIRKDPGLFEGIKQFFQNGKIRLLGNEIKLIGLNKEAQQSLNQFCKNKDDIIPTYSYLFTNGHKSLAKLTYEQHELLAGKRQYYMVGKTRTIRIIGE